MSSSESRTMDTELVDLSSVPLSVLPGVAELAAATRDLVEQVRQQRVNLGTGPPGRAD